MNIISRKVAMTQNLMKYFTGKPCRKGHISERYTRNWNCIACVAIRPSGAQYVAKYYQSRRKRVIDMLGGVCAHCGLLNTNILHVDHKNGGGTIARTKSSRIVFDDILTRGLIEQYQLLCPNCNWVKRTTNNEVVSRNPNNYWIRLRKRIFDSFGNQCTKCGNSDTRCLQLDHKNGGGTKESKLIGPAGVYRKALKEPNNYQILCANCNWEKEILQGSR
jgi:hypothetical protein